MSARPSATPLGLDADDLASCVACGLCLPHCPTFRATGEEGYSPRGRIDAMRAVEFGARPLDARFVDFMETCVQCRGCEPACPSGVPFGSLMEDTRRALVDGGRTVPWWQRRAYAVLGHHRLLLAGSSALALAQRLRLVPTRPGIPRLPLRRPADLRRGAVADPDVWLFTGCVMDAWQRGVHHRAAALIIASGASYGVAARAGACCGALHLHAGLHDGAVAFAERVMDSMPGHAPVLVDSAGCGATMKEYGSTIGTPEAIEFSSRVLDVHEWLAHRLELLPPPVEPERPPVIVHDPCHLRHVQRAHGAVRAVLAHVAEIVELDDDGVCCGAGGAYAAQQPELAASVRERKLAAIARAGERSGATVVASANPGCTFHLAAALAATGVEVVHPVELLAARSGLVTDG